MTRWQILGRRWKAFWIRLTHWEFWPASIFYIPVGLNIVRLSIKYRGLLLPLATNPGKHKGAYIGESKGRSLGLLQSKFPVFIAESWLVEGDSPEERTRFVEDLITQDSVSFPFILKPDDGNRGSGVRLVRSSQDIGSYFKTMRGPVVMQRNVAGPKEVGVFYIRHPEEEKGHIFSITRKEFPFVVGDGESTLEDLIWRDERAYLVADTYLNRFSSDLPTVPTKGEHWRLVNAGNHAQGCVFFDGMNLASEALLDQLDAIAKGFPKFYLGRFDLRYAKDEDLMKGKGFKILEVNGSLSEATSIYEPGHPLGSAYRTLFEQWDQVYKIGAHNRDHAGTTMPTILQMLAKGREYKKLRATHPDAD
ncbi:carboxylate--amine ligase [Verrucomicrobia bacterium]|nr:carboxylate--amine ligase [Verrucomicrobiota bacterium]